MSDVIKALLIALGASVLFLIIVPFLPLAVGIIVTIAIIIAAIAVFCWLVRFTFSSVGAFIIVLLIAILLLIIF